MAGQLRAPLVTLDPLVGGVPALRSNLVTSEPLTDGQPFLRSSLVVVESTNEGYSNLRISLLCVESLCPVFPGGNVSTALFPGTLGSPTALPGLTFSIHKRPTFSTSTYKGASGVSVRRANMQYPIWEFELSYSFLRDNVNAEFQTMCGFFMQRQGSFDTFLFKDSDDYQVTNGVLATGDGVTTQFPFLRSLGGYNEKVGQVDQGQTITIYGTVAQSSSIPAGGPYTIAVTNSATFVANVGVTKAGVAMTKVVSSPITGQYSITAGVYTFAAADANAVVIITYSYTILGANYTVTMPNLIIFTSSPALNTIISADFQFFFNCRFQDDTADFSKFASTFWDLQKIVLETVPQ